MKGFRTMLSDVGLLYAAAIWGATFFMVKNVLHHVTPLGLLGYRFLIAAVIMLILLLLLKRNPFTDWKQGLILGFFLWTIYVPQTIGLKFTTASNSGFITGLFIVFVPLFAFVFMKKLPSPMKLISIALAVSGLFVLTGGLHDANFGDFLTLFAAMGYAIHILIADRFMKNGADPFILNFQQMLVVGLLSIAVGLSSSTSLSCDCRAALGVIVFLAVFPTVSAFIIQLVAQRNTSPVKVAIIFSMEPVFAALFAWTYGNELIVPHRALGGLLIVAAMVLSELPIGQRERGEIHAETAPH
ncbi:MAG: EamA/RhaT family transporter [Acidobacteria bacterium]|nr:MAG: EamA/RhaT family transporter [Acidobacteriota bacterium]RLE24529.1 MAG: EamA/RhaT family transporter [Acidobacteriota bacterium]